MFTFNVFGGNVLDAGEPIGSEISIRLHARNQQVCNKMTFLLCSCVPLYEKTDLCCDSRVALSGYDEKYQSLAINM